MGDATEPGEQVVGHGTPVAREDTDPLTGSSSWFPRQSGIA
ncbi:hypothetical protein [Nocardioides dilutus]